jgi:tetratricopeptide (TPR) repeat protein
LDPGFAMAAVALAQGYAQTGRRARCDSLLQIADRLAQVLDDPTERMLVQVRLADLGLKTWAGARDSLHAALGKTAPDNLILLTSLAAQAKRDNDADAAERIFRRILELDPNYAAAYNELGYLEFSRGRTDQAVALLQRYAFLAPDLANPFDSLGEVYLETGHYAEAELQLRQALSLQPDYLPSLLNLANVYLAQGQSQKGADLIAQVDRQMCDTPFAPEVRYFAIRAFLRYGLLDELERLAPDFADMPGAKKELDQLAGAFEAINLQRQGRSSEAAVYWRQTLDQVQDKRRPHELVPIREKYAASLLESGQAGPAFDQAAMVLSLNPRNHQALLTAATASLDLGRVQAAREFLDRLDQALALADPALPCLAMARDLRGRLSLLAVTP